VTDEVDAADLNEIDAAALRRCVEIQLAPGNEDGPFVRHMLRTRPWVEVALWCSHHCQYWALGLRPWGPPPPASAEPSEDDPAVRELLARLAAAGLSRFEPSPIEALRAAEAKPPPKPKPRR